jgi:hypothetical protein
MFSEIKERLNLTNIDHFNREECEDRLMLIRYLLRRENNSQVAAEFNPYILQIEARINVLNAESPDL